MLSKSRNFILGDDLKNEAWKEAIYVLDSIGLGNKNIYQLREKRNANLEGCSCP